MQTDEIQSALPGPDGREPPSLRRDIVDELSDHLRCATQRELRRSTGSPGDPASEREAWLAAMDKFGNPRGVARKLYFDAMKGIIMKDRILLTAVCILTIVCLASVALSWSAMSQSREANARVLASLEAITASLAAGGDNMEWNELVVTLREGSETGPPPDDAYEVEIEGHAINFGQKTRLKTTVDANGVAKFGPIRPGNYLILIRSRSWHRGWNDITVTPGKSCHMTIVSPAGEPDIVTVTPVIQWPEGGSYDDVYVHFGVAMRLERGASDPLRWRPVMARSALVGHDGGKIMTGYTIKESGADHSELLGVHSPEHGTWKLPPGKHRVSVEFVRRIRDEKGEWTDKFTKLKSLPSIELDLTDGTKTVELPIEVPSDLGT